MCSLHRIWSKIIKLLIDITSSKSARPSSGNTLSCMRDDVTIVDDYKQGTPIIKYARDQELSNESVNSSMLSSCMSRKLSEVWLCDLWSDIGQLNWRNPHGDHDAIRVSSTFTEGCAPTIYGLSTMTSRQSSSPIGGKGNPKLLTAPSL